MNTKSRCRSFTPLLRPGAGFTLIELLLVIGIIIILAGIAIPNFAKAKERALTKEAMANLKLIAAAERVWRMEDATNGYTACTCNAAGTGANQCNCCVTPPNTGCNTLLRLSLTPQNWTYSVGVTSGPPPTFTATAQRTGTGPYSGCQYEIRHDSTTGEPTQVVGTTCP